MPAYWIIGILLKRMGYCEEYCVKGRKIKSKPLKLK